MKLSVSFILKRFFIYLTFLVSCLSVFKFCWPSPDLRKHNITTSCCSEIIELIWTYFQKILEPFWGHLQILPKSSTKNPIINYFYFSLNLIQKILILFKFCHKIQKFENSYTLTWQNSLSPIRGFWTKVLYRPYSTLWKMFSPKYIIII